jgi:hypothetical protein
MNCSINTTTSEESAVCGVHDRVNRESRDITAKYPDVGRHNDT